MSAVGAKVALTVRCGPMVAKISCNPPPEDLTAQLHVYVLTEHEMPRQ
jgi:hypothetical protein